MKIGDKFKITKHIKYSCGKNRTVTDINNEDRFSHSLFDKEWEVLDIKENLLFFEKPNAPDNEKAHPYVTTKQELERIGINTKIDTMKYKVGDTFKFKNVEMSYRASSDTKWTVDNDWEYEYKIYKITKTLVYFDDLDYTGSVFFVVKRSDFDKNAIFEETKKIVGYKIIKQYPGMNIDYLGEIVKPDLWKLPDGSYVPGLALENNGEPTNEKFYNKSFVGEFFEPVFEEKFKIGDYIIHKKAKEGYLPNCPRQVGRINETHVYYKDEPLNGITISNIRKATEEEIKEYLDNKRVIKNLGSNNITLRWDGGNKLIPEGFKTDFITLSFLKDYYQQLLNVKVIAVGTFNTDFADIRFIRIGCATYNNLVSLKEIKRVIDFCK